MYYCVPGTTGTIQIWYQVPLESATRYHSNWVGLSGQGKHMKKCARNQREGTVPLSATHIGPREIITKKIAKIIRLHFLKKEITKMTKKLQASQHTHTSITHHTYTSQTHNTYNTHKITPNTPHINYKHASHIHHKYKSHTQTNITHIQRQTHTIPLCRVN